MKLSEPADNGAWVAAFVALVSAGPFVVPRSNAAELSDNLDYVLPLIKASAGLPTQVTITRGETVPFRDPKTSAGQTANLTAGSTYPLARVDGNKAVLKYEYTDTVIGGYRVRDSFAIGESPQKEIKTVTKQADVSVPLASTDIAERMISELKFPPSTVLLKDVVLPVVIDGRQVGKGPVKTGQSVAVVEVIEASAQLEVDFKGTQRGTIDISATDWGTAVSDLRRRQGVSEPAAPAPEPQPMIEPSQPTSQEMADPRPQPTPEEPRPRPAPAPAEPESPKMPEGEKPTPEIPAAPSSPASSPSDTAAPGDPKPAPRAAELAASAGETSAPGASGLTPADTPGSGGSQLNKSVIITIVAVGAVIAIVIGLSLAIKIPTRTKRKASVPPVAELAQTRLAAGHARSFAAVDPTIPDTRLGSRKMGREVPDPGDAVTVRMLRPGETVFARYALKRMLGRGGMGVVWEAADKALDQDVALKFLPDIVCHDPDALQELKRETRRCLRLTHPNIVRIFDFVSDDESSAIAMELIDGPTLAARRLSQPDGVFAAEALVGWVGDLCLALDYAHLDAKVVHRDLKPANLMLTSGGRLKVTDFGVARSVSDSVSRVSLKTTTSGTIAFMSPQQAMGEPPSISDDVYAVGATLFQLLAGTPPFYSGEVFMQLLHKLAPTVADRRLESGIEADGVPEHWEEVIATCLAKDPAQRPDCAGQIAERLGI